MTSGYDEVKERVLVERNFPLMSLSSCPGTVQSELSSSTEERKRGKNDKTASLIAESRIIMSSHL